MIRLAICDDDCNIVESIEAYIDRVKQFSIKYMVFYSAEELWEYGLSDKEQFDVYFLDIEMKSMSGLEVAKKIRNDNPHAIIIFLTNYTKYVYDVFEVVTFDFIIKPMSFEKFKEIILRIVNYFGIAKNKFVFSYKKNSYSIPLQNINYIEKLGRKVIIHTIDEKIYQCNMNLEEVWKQLNDYMFASLHQSCIVNLEEIVEIEGEEVKLRNETQLFVSRNYRKNLKENHLKFLKEQV